MVVFLTETFSNILFTVVQVVLFFIRAVHKRTFAQNREKLTPFPLVRKMSILAQPPLSVRTKHKFRKIRSFLRQKVRTFASEETPLSALDKPPPPRLRTSFMDGPLPVIRMPRSINFVQFFKQDLAGKNAYVAYYSGMYCTIGA